MMLFSCLAVIAAMGSVPDTTRTSGVDKSERNMMLNAESATVPREINIGLPDTGSGATVYLDGTKSSYGLPRPHYHWAGGNSYTSVGMLSLMEAVIMTGQVGVMVDSRTRLGADDIEGKFTAGSSSNGLVRFDGALSGPLAKARGWYYSLGAYVNYDPTNVNAPSRKYIDQKQIYQFSLSRRRGTVSTDLIYRLSLCDGNVDGGYSVAPFVFKGDGSIRTYAGFRIGRDCYFPQDDQVQWMDIRTGEMRQDALGRMDHRIIHDISLVSTGQTSSGWHLSSLLHACIYTPGQEARISLAGIEDVSSSDGYASPDGKTYVGAVQKRLVLVEQQESADIELLLKAERSFGTHRLRSGLSAMYIQQRQVGSSFYFAHSAEASPVRLLRKDELTWGLNRNGIYNEGRRIQSSLYIMDDWGTGKRLTGRTGLRIKPVYQSLKTAAVMEGDTKNIRVEGFNIADPSLCALHRLRQTPFDYSFSENAVYNIHGRMFAMAEGFYSLTSKALKYYRNATIPSTKPVGIAMVRGGLMWDNDWMDISALASYITSWDDALVINVTNPSGTETIPWTAQFGIGTPGVTLDGNVHHRGFKLHFLGTWQDPRYRNYSNEFVFSDGTRKSIDYTGNIVTGISKVMLEFDPSYTCKAWRFWASSRYYSRQYVSRTNLAYFDGHWETFAGVDWKVSDHIRLSLDMVNLLGQNGAKGSIDAVDTITDPSMLQDYVMSGSYIRPFCLNLSITCTL